jgi:IS605 OrfB family transposase
MNMYLVQKNRIRNLTKKEFTVLRLLSRLSKNIYNVTLWETKQYYELNVAFLTYNNAYHVVKNNENFTKLPMEVAENTMKIVERSFRSFFSLLKKKRNGNYIRPANLPSFLPKDGFFICIFGPHQIRVVDNGELIRLSLGRWITTNESVRYLFFKLPPTVIGHQIKEIRVLPRYRGQYFEIEHVYLQEPILTDLDTNEYLGIDLGVGNLAACVSTTGPSFIIDGRKLKSYNRLWNKRKAQFQSVHDKQGVERSEKKARLFWQRSDYIRNYMAQSVNYIVKCCISNKIGNIAVGELKNIKQNATLGRHNNQNFQSIPFGLFKQKIRSKCELYGITYHEVSESYTSQTCCVCGRIRKKNRVYRGLYKCDRCGAVINADINSAVNIARQCNPDSFQRTIGTSGTVNVPVRIRIVV